MKNIKIFVSHRIDIESVLVESPLYVHVRCGAVFDEENPMNIVGDHSGENISAKRMSFCELTVQYWAWKNQEADYYGLCHYRRYLSFSEKEYKKNEWSMIHVPFLNHTQIKKFKLEQKNTIDPLLENYSIITPIWTPVSRIPLPEPKKPAKTVLELWKSHEGLFFESGMVELLLRKIKILYPNYYNSAIEYLNGTKHCGFNCYILKKEIFNQLCEFQFPLLFLLESEIDTTNYDQTMKRTVAFLGEIMFGIFMYHCKVSGIPVKEQPIIFFNNTEKKSHSSYVKQTIFGVLDGSARKMVDPFFPKGSKRREWIKKIYFKYTFFKQRGMANIE